MKRLTAGIATVLVLGAMSACIDDLTVPDGPAPTLALVAEDVDALIGGAMAPWWRSAHGFHPGPALSTAADAHTSSWKNWGMLDAGTEPRLPLSTDPEYRFNFTDVPWTELNRALSSVRDGIMMLDAAGADPGDGGDVTRAYAFGRFMQGMALGQLAQLFDAAFVVDETTDLETVTLSGYADVMAAALARMGEAVDLAEGADFTVPADWVAFDRDMSSSDLARLARSYRARLAISVARTPAERAAVDWAAVLEDVRAGITTDWIGRYDGDYENNWAWAADKLWAGSQPLWGRLDYRTVGPADHSGQYQAWLTAPPSFRNPFLILTEDRRVTGPEPTDAGKYAAYDVDIRMRPERGVDHFSYYTDTRWYHLFTDTENGAGDYPDFPVKELDFIEAEALYRLGDLTGAMAIVNGWRANGELPAFTDPNGTAPGVRCAPRTADGECGDLWEALKYEKRIEVFHYGPFTEFLDDRGWGDLVAGTFTSFPAPSATLAPILSKVYGVDLDAAVEFAAERTVVALKSKRARYADFDQERMVDPGDVGGN